MDTCKKYYTWHYHPVSQTSSFHNMCANYKWLYMVFRRHRKNFYSSAVGTSFFIQKSKNGLLALLLYVDDMLISSSSIKHLQGFLADLKSEFNMKDVGIVHYFLGIEIVKTDTRLFLTQGWYAEKIFKRANMLDCKPSDTNAFEAITTRIIRIIWRCYILQRDCWISFNTC